MTTTKQTFGTAQEVRDYLAQFGFAPFKKAIGPDLTEVAGPHYGEVGVTGRHRPGTKKAPGRGLRAFLCTLIVIFVFVVAEFKSESASAPESFVKPVTLALPENIEIIKSSIQPEIGSTLVNFSGLSAGQLVNDAVKWPDTFADRKHLLRFIPNDPDWIKRLSRIFQIATDYLDNSGCFSEVIEKYPGGRDIGKESIGIIASSPMLNGIHKFHEVVAINRDIESSSFGSDGSIGGFLSRGSGNESGAYRSVQKECLKCPNGDKQESKQYQKPISGSAGIFIAGLLGSAGLLLEFFGLCRMANHRVSAAILLLVGACLALAGPISIIYGVL